MATDDFVLSYYIGPATVGAVFVGDPLAASIEIGGSTGVELEGVPVSLPAAALAAFELDFVLYGGALELQAVTDVALDAIAKSHIAGPSQEAAAAIQANFPTLAYSSTPGGPLLAVSGQFDVAAPTYATALAEGAGGSAAASFEVQVQAGSNYIVDISGLSAEAAFDLTAAVAEALAQTAHYAGAVQFDGVAEVSAAATIEAAIQTAFDAAYNASEAGSLSTSFDALAGTQFDVAYSLLEAGAFSTAFEIGAETQVSFEQTVAELGQAVTTMAAAADAQLDIAALLNAIGTVEAVAETQFELDQAINTPESLAAAVVAQFDAAIGSGRAYAFETAAEAVFEALATGQIVLGGEGGGGAPIIESVTPTIIPPGLEAVDPVFAMPEERPDGDLYLVFVARDHQHEVTVPGWNTIIATANPADDHLYSYIAWRWGSSEPATYQAIASSGEYAAIAVLRISGARSPIPVAASDFDHADSGTVAPAPSVTPAEAETLVLRFFQADSDSIGTVPPTVVINHGGGANLLQGAAISQEPGPDAGQPTGVASASGFNDNWFAATVAIAGTGAPALELFQAGATFEAETTASEAGSTTTTFGVATGTIFDAIATARETTQDSFDAVAGIAFDVAALAAGKWQDVLDATADAAFDAVHGVSFEATAALASDTQLDASFALNFNPSMWDFDDGTYFEDGTAWYDDLFVSSAQFELGYSLIEIGYRLASLEMSSGIQFDLDAVSGVAADSTVVAETAFDADATARPIILESIEAAAGIGFDASAQAVGLFEGAFEVAADAQMDVAEYIDVELAFAASAGVPTIESVTPTIVTTGQNPVFSMPAVRPDGDLYIAFIARDHENVVSLAGWNTLASMPNLTNNTQYTHIAWRWGNSEPATYQATAGSSEYAAIAVLRISGARETTPISASDFDRSDSGTSATAPSISPAEAETLVLRLFQVDSDAIGSVPPIVALNHGGGATLRQGQAISYEDGPEAGQPTGTATAFNFDDNWFAMTIAVAPAAATGEGLFLTDARFDASYTTGESGASSTTIEGAAMVQFDATLTAAEAGVDLTFTDGTRFSDGTSFKFTGVSAFFAAEAQFDVSYAASETGAVTTTADLDADVLFDLGVTADELSLSTATLEATADTQFDAATSAEDAYAGTHAFTDGTRFTDGTAFVFPGLNASLDADARFDVTVSIDDQTERFDDLTTWDDDTVWTYFGEPPATATASLEASAAAQLALTHSAVAAAGDTLDRASYASTSAWLADMESQQKSGRIGSGTYDVSGLTQTILTQSIYGYDSGGGKPILNGNGSGNLFYIKANGVVIDGIEFRNIMYPFVSVDTTVNTWARSNLGWNSNNFSALPAGLYYNADLNGFSITNCRFDGCGIISFFTRDAIYDTDGTTILTDARSTNNIVFSNNVVRNSTSCVVLRGENFQEIYLEDNDIQDMICSPSGTKDSTETIFLIGRVNDGTMFARNTGIYCRRNYVRNYVSTHSTGINAAVVLDVRVASVLRSEDNVFINCYNTGASQDANATYLKCRGDVIFRRNYTENCGSDAITGVDEGTEGGHYAFKGGSDDVLIEDCEMVAGPNCHNNPMITVGTCDDVRIVRPIFRNWNCTGPWLKNGPPGMVRHWRGDFGMNITDPTVDSCGYGGSISKAYMVIHRWEAGGPIVHTDWRVNWNGTNERDIIFNDNNLSITLNNCQNTIGQTIQVTSG